MSVKKIDITARVYADFWPNERLNAMIDNIGHKSAPNNPDGFLDGFTSFTITLASFAPDLDTTLKIPLFQGSAEAKTKAAYVEILINQVSEGQLPATTLLATYYYYVRDIKRLANNTAILTLRMDTLNTYASAIKNAMTARTMIYREHLRRFYPHASSTGFPKTNERILRDISKTKEGINAIFHKESGPFDIIGDDVNELGNNFYLIYKTKDELSEANLSNPVTLQMVSDNAILSAKGATGDLVTYSLTDLSSGFYYYVTSKESAGGYLQTSGTTLQPLSANVPMEVFFVSGSNIKICSLTINSDGSQSLSQYYTASSVTLHNIKKYYQLNYFTEQLSLIESSAIVGNVNSGTIADQVTRAFSQIDRTDSKIVKIIKLPYPPTSHYRSALGEYSFDGFEYDQTSGTFQANSVSIEMSNDMLSSVYPSLTRTINYADRYSMIAASRDTSNESKLFSSELYALKINYDSFALTIPLEYCKATEEAHDAYFALAFKPTNTINSNFAFKVSPHLLAWTDQEQDYNNFILSTRNNEVSIFSNSYVDYIKNGFNYDKKSKALSTSAAWIGAALSTAGGIAAAALGPDAFTKATGVGLAVSGVAQLSTAISTTISNENSLAAKLAKLKAESTAVNGSDDIDLLTWYGNNKLQWSIWSASDQVKEMAYGLFFYYGYSLNYQGVPDFNSRVWFNFVQCDAVFSTAFQEAMKKDILDDITARFKEGVTIYHENEVGEYTYDWDFDQEKENWETFLAQ